MSKPALYDTLGAGYGRTRRADPQLAETLARRLALPAGGCGLDLACGSGNYTAAMAARGGRWCGLDESATMLAQARQKAAAVDWVRGDAAALPFADGCFDAVLCTLAIHHFPALQAPFAQVRRVLRRGARFVIFTAFAEQMRHYWLGRYFPRMMALSAAKMPARAQLLDRLHAAGFSGSPRCARPTSWPRACMPCAPIWTAGAGPRPGAHGAAAEGDYAIVTAHN